MDESGKCIPSVYWSEILENETFSLGIGLYRVAIYKGKSLLNYENAIVVLRACKCSKKSIEKVKKTVKLSGVKNVEIKIEGLIETRSYIYTRQKNIKRGIQPFKW